jgi:hypothetical protein
MVDYLKAIWRFFLYFRFFFLAAAAFSFATLLSFQSWHSTQARCMHSDVSSSSLLAYKLTTSTAAFVTAFQVMSCPPDS